MVRRPVNPPAQGWSLTFRPRDWTVLADHLFTDGDEHGAVVLARVAAGPRGPRLLAEHVLLATDGVDYVAGEYGYRALAAPFVRDAALHARRLGLAYLAFHNHRGTTQVEFSGVDLASHRRGYPALRQITGQPVGGVVCTPYAAAGDLWLSDGTRTSLAEVVVPSGNFMRLRPKPAPTSVSDAQYDRQARLFGDAGQECFRKMRIAVIGQGGVGSLLTEMLARLGVGSLVLVEPELIEESNVPRLVGADVSDIGTAKVELGVRNARRANPNIYALPLRSRIESPVAWAAVAQCDWIFLAADSHAARHVVTTLVEEYLIPGTQLGVKIPVAGDGAIGRVHVATRLLIPGEGCMWCNNLIDSTELAIDMHPELERDAARYVEGVPAASVISLNAMTASQAVTDFMLTITQLHEEEADHLDVYVFPRNRVTNLIKHRRDPGCDLCGDKVM
ncbi:MULTISPECIES: ThiF family adenylyltransferase [Rhodococcus]|uniref:ThiF family adenylyltransferase n=1 Tax=Rhodococcus TaxID=1827 RepID=UPI000C9A64C5|nr:MULTISPECIES: ThiF family adenylyltransferase [Rhodococcus]PND53872.1 thiamine biosynthesis protein ThiF [Rhodococcus sp. ENV425]WKX01772.1 ThiF family adenylyltransferase [Rhodococcus aetherivorans]